MQRRGLVVGVVAVLAAAAPMSAYVLGGGTSVLGAPADAAAAAPEDVALATLAAPGGARVGDVRLVGRGGQTRVTVTLDAPGLAVAGGAFHGFHVHANDDAANGSGCTADPSQPSSTWFTAVDGHYTKAGAVHGDHLGDLPTVYLQADGKARSTVVTDRFTPTDVVGRAFIVHLGPDNHGNVPTGTAADQYTANSPDAVTKTDKTGNAGDRAACGVIRR